MDLKFDEMTVDTSKAEKYLENNEGAYNLHHNYSKVVDEGKEFDGKQFVKKTNEYKTIKLTATEKEFRDLALRLQEKYHLITQLEYLIRNIPIEDTEAQLDLIIQHLNCHKPVECVNISSSGYQYMYPNDVLLHLGGLVYTPIKFSITAYKSTAVITHLFVKLCHEAGLNFMKLQFDVNPKICDSPDAREETKWLCSGTIAVVSENADIDSAVHTFLTASVKAPWRLHKILVQENVYNEFKDALRWKCNFKQQDVEASTPNEPCSEALVYYDRVFAIDPVVIKGTASTVLIKAYRTTKEMISFLLKDNVRYLSLWSNDIAEVNEVTYSIKSPIVWVNSFADFRGPPQIAKAVFYHSFDTDYFVLNLRDMWIKNLCNHSKSWLELGFQRRLQILKKVLDNHIKCDPILKEKIINSLHDCEMQSIVDVGKDYVCLVTSQPVDGIIAMKGNESFVNEGTFKSLLRGNGFLIYNSDYEKFDQEINFNELKNEGIPVMFLSGLPIDEEAWMTDTYVKLYSRRHGTSRYRAIWTYSGTIFAN